ncbi:MAG TPA: hypothetical protein VFP20_07495 [Bacteroidales bacterium]|nr:hypothetical protein [Bacteroidales bacterium]
MKNRLILSLLIFSLGCLYLEASNKDSIDMQTQISMYGLLNPENTITFSAGARVLPQVDYLRDFSRDRRVSAEVSGNFSLNADLLPRAVANDHDPVFFARLYRAWVRFSSQRNEIRAGLQQLNFGSASLLRPLQWFDGINPTDPLRLTNGVWGILDRIYFENNATLWLWGLYGNGDKRIWDFNKPQKDLPDFGFRFEHPVAQGEVAVSVNHRPVEVNVGTDLESRFQETKIGLDGKWDLGPGIWFEDSYTVTSKESPFQGGWNLLTVGADLTPEGLDGVSFTAEHLLSTNFSSVNNVQLTTNLSALSVTWPINMINRLSGIALYSWENDFWFRFLTFSADYDRSSFYLISFWNSSAPGVQLPMGSVSFSGYGLQLMYVVHL